MSKVILIDNCQSCPHSHDWSSGGVVCGKAYDKVIIAGYGSRKTLLEKIPEWCPLPTVTDMEYTKH